MEKQRFASAQNATSTLSFSGDSITVYGSVGPQNSAYTAQMDQGSPVSFNASRSAFFDQQVIYYADNLGPGNHVLQLTNEPTSNGGGLAINFAVVTSVSDNSQ
jgi:hypothetical protein